MFLITVEKRTIQSIREPIIKWIHDNVKTLKFPDNFPHLQALVGDDKQNLVHKLEQTFQQKDDSTTNNTLNKTTLIVVEKDNSYLGRELILDFYSTRNEITLFRMVESDVRLLDQILPKSLDSFALPFLLQFDKGNFNLILK